MKRLLLFTLLAASAWAETPAETVRYFKLDLVVKELDGTKVVNSRNFTLAAAGNGAVSMVRTKSDVSLEVAPGTRQTAQIGISIDCHDLTIVGEKLGVKLDLSIDSFVPDQPAGTVPVKRNINFRGAALVPFNKPTIVLTSDDTATKHTFELQLTAIPLQ